MAWKWEFREGWRGLSVDPSLVLNIEIEITTGHRQVTIQIPSPVFDQGIDITKALNSIQVTSKIHSFGSLCARLHHRFIGGTAITDAVLQRSAWVR